MPFIPDFLASQTRMVRTASGKYVPENDDRPLRPEEHDALVAYHSSESDRHRKVVQDNPHDRNYSSYHRAAAAGHEVANPSNAKPRSIAEQKRFTQYAQAASSKADNMLPEPVESSPNWITELPTWQR